MALYFTLMEIDHKRVFLTMGVIALFLVSVVVSQYLNAVNKAHKLQISQVQIGKLQFRGKVINSKIYKYGGKNYYMVCIKLNYANVKSFYIYNNINCLKIKNGIATIAAGYLNNTLGVVDSVAFNIDNNNKVIYHYKDNARDVTPLTLDPKGLPESDLDACN